MKGRPDMCRRTETSPNPGVRLLGELVPPPPSVERNALTGQTNHPTQASSPWSNRHLKHRPNDLSPRLSHRKPNPINTFVQCLTHPPRISHTDPYAPPRGLSIHPPIAHFPLPLSFSSKPPSLPPPKPYTRPRLYSPKNIQPSRDRPLI